MKRVSTRAALIALSLAISGCVTINIYFPAAAAEKAADRIIDEVWQLKPDAATKEGERSR
ncbi:MAG: hypothetical protein DWQ11_15795 [Proteobacteria bacterium]|nr:MAG: hypothetical protein DWQ11_15795 [Pseudomonadota bacterium]